jgi:hypothetical protein
VQPLAYLLEMHPDIQSVIQIPVHLKGTEHYSNPIKMIEESEKCFTVLQFPESIDGLGFTEAAKAKFDRVVNFTNIYFTGLHPDATYIGGMGKRFLSPVGDYHSRITYLAYSRGLGVEACVKKFSSETYEKLGYYSQWDSSSLELINRDAKNDVKFAEEFLEITSRNLTLLTFNHPTSLVFNKLANRLLNFIGLKEITLPIESQPNFLATNAFWPVYENLDLSRKVSYKTPFIFKSADSFGKKIFNLDRFVSTSYDLYQNYGLENIIKPYFYESQKDLL